MPSSTPNPSPTTGHILTATLNMESLKTSFEIRTEFNEWSYFVNHELTPEPTTEHAEAFTERSRQQIAHEFLIAVAWFLRGKNMTHYYLYTGYRPSTPSNRWEVYVAFGRAKLTDTKRISIRQELIERFFTAPLDVDVEVTSVDNTFADVYLGLEAQWGGQAQWYGMSRLVVWQGRAYLVERDGQRDCGVLARLEGAMVEGADAVQQALMGIRLGMIQSPRLERYKEQRGLALEQALMGLILSSPGQMLDGLIVSAVQSP
ncbi:hypothetical protein BDW74DRAFT_184085 [Aspergillus multicolor]|uniref:uncharacterized protein n=1 Tax=Aspergillus multicolor TaxID=41759 RepID=UPI003CCE1E29